MTRLLDHVDKYKSVDNTQRPTDNPVENNSNWASVFGYILDTYCSECPFLKWEKVDVE